LTERNRQYHTTTYAEIVYPRLAYFKALAKSGQAFLSEPPFSNQGNPRKVESAIATNAKVAAEIISHGIGVCNEYGLNIEERDCQEIATASDLAIARSTIRQFYRDWSEQRAAERNVCHETVLQDLSVEFASVPDKRGLHGIVPGAGLCQLPFNIASARYTTEANKISYHQLLASHFMLCHTTCAPKQELYPWALIFSNHLVREDQFEKVMIPDVHAGRFLSETSFASALSLATGERNMHTALTLQATGFVTDYSGYSNESVFDAVATVFFIDTAPSLLRYIKTVWNCLKPNGV
jgi:carnosine N-methyltransferase